MRQKAMATFTQYRTQPLFVVVFLLILLYLMINIFFIGGETFVFNLNNNLSNPLAFFVAILAFMLWRQIPAENQSRLLWAGLALGWALWTIAEFWWGGMALINKEVPYPSWADFFWLIGYLPMYFALWIRVRSLPSNLNSSQRKNIWISVFIVLVCTMLFIVLPTLQSDDTADIFVSILNILYPLVDVVLLVLVLRIFFAYQRGRYGNAWGWLSAGFLLHSFSNLFFSYASVHNIYYPDGRVNFVSAFATDIPYNLSYVLWIVGMLALRNLQKMYISLPRRKNVMAPVPNTHVIIYTKSDDTIMDVSQNYGHVFPVGAAKQKQMTEALGISSDELTQVFAEIKNNKSLQERPITLVSNEGSQDALISGIAIFNPQNEYAGSTFLIRLFKQDDSLDEMLQGENQGMLGFLLEKTGVKEKRNLEIQQLLSEYYLSYIRGFYDRILVEGGWVMTDALLTELQSEANKNGWHLEYDPENFIALHDLTVDVSKKAFPVLFDATKNFVKMVTDDQTVETVVQTINYSIDESVHKSIQKYIR